MSYDSVLVFKEKSMPQLTELIDSMAEKRIIEAHTQIIQPGDDLRRIIYIADGRTRHFSMSTDGVERIIYILNTGYFIGEGAFVSYVNRGKSSRFTKTETNCTLYWIYEDAYNKLKQYPLFTDALLASSAKKNAFLRHEVENMSFLLFQNRLINLLKAAADTSISYEDWHPVKVNISQSDIAAILGANRVTVSKAIKKLTDEEVIRIVNRNMQIHKSFCLKQEMK